MDARVIRTVIEMLERQRAELDAQIADLHAHLAAAERRDPSGRWDAEDDAEMLRLADKRGMTHQQIAAVLGRTTTAIAKRLSRLRRGE